MAFQIKFYKSGNEARLVQKTLPTPVTLQGTTKEACDIVDPVVLVEYTTSGNFEFNYCYIAQWSRYYFITKKVVEQTGLWTISMHCDVLMTYGADIDPLHAYVARNENLYDVNLVDTRYPFGSHIRSGYINFPSTPFSTSAHTGDSAQNIILTTATDKSSLMSTSSTGDISPLHRPAYDFSPISVATNSYKIDVHSLVTMIGELLNMSTYESLIDGNKAEGIVSVMMLPFEIPDAFCEMGSSTVTVFNGKMFTDVRGFLIKTGAPLDFDFGEIDVPGGNYQYREPYVRYSLYLPYIGFTDIAASEIEGSKLRVRYVVDIMTGKCDAYIIMKRGVTTAKVIKIVTGSIGQPIPISTSNAVEVARNMVNNTIALASSAVAFGVSAGTGNPAGMIGGATGLVNAGVGLVANPTIIRGSVGSVQTAYYAPQTAVLYSLTQEANTAHLSNYAKYEGLPYMGDSELSLLTGYTEIERIHLTGLTHATSGEVDELESLLKSGVIFGPTPHYT